METMLWLATLGSLAVAAAFWARSRGMARAVTVSRAALVEAQGAADLEALRADVRRLTEQVTSDAGRLSERLEGIDHRMSSTQNTSAEMAQNIFSTLGEVKSATETVATQAREFSALQDLLRAPKARGAIGEAMLEELLRQVLPPNAYAVQHRFRSGAIVDAVVKAGGRLVLYRLEVPPCELPSHVRDHIRYRTR